MIGKIINGIYFENNNPAAEDDLTTKVFQKKMKQKEFEKMMREYQLRNGSITPEFHITIKSEVKRK